MKTSRTVAEIASEITECKESIHRIENEIIPNLNDTAAISDLSAKADQFRDRLAECVLEKEQAIKNLLNTI